MPRSTSARRSARSATASPSSATRSAWPAAGSPPTPPSALVDAVGADLRQLSAAASQLVSDFGGTIDADAVARFHQGQAEVTGFTVAERVLVGDRAGSIEMLRWALQRGVAHVLIADAIADGVRTAARVASLSTTNPGELARVLKLPPWKVKKAQAQSRGWSIDGLQQAIGVAAELNADVKGAAASADYALERAVRRIVTIRCGDGARGAGARRPLSAAAATPENARAPSHEGRGSFARTRSAQVAARRLRGRRPAWPDPTCGWRPGSCG